MSNIGGRPYPFSYYVFTSSSENPTDQERDAGVYLISAADARYLQMFFDPLYEGAGIGICTSDDEVICGGDKLAAIETAVSAAIVSLQVKPQEWPEVLGYRVRDHEEALGAPVVEMALPSLPKKATGPSYLGPDA